MATLNLGRIKPVFRGAYSGSTAYVVDDIVTHGNESFICIQAHGAGTQATSVTAYWTKLAAKGTDGTDVGTTITTQGDILFRDGSGLQRLASSGHGSKTLQMNSGATAPEWVTVTPPSSDVVKIATADATSGTVQNYENIFDDSVYRAYRIYANWAVADGESVKARFLNDSTAYSGSTDYRYSGIQSYRQLDNSNNVLSANNDGDGKSYLPLGGWGFSPTTATRWGCVCDIMTGMENTSFHKLIFTTTHGIDNSGTNYVFTDLLTQTFYNTGEVNGIQFYTSAAVENFAISIYGYKK